jgi:hypothetical protein
MATLLEQRPTKLHLKRDKHMDRHQQKKGIKDIRGLPKKNGAGKGNWGKAEDDINYHTPSQAINSPSVQVVNQETFLKLKQ